MNKHKRKCCKTCEAQLAKSRILVFDTYEDLEEYESIVSEVPRTCDCKPTNVQYGKELSRMSFMKSEDRKEVCNMQCEVTFLP